MDNSFKLIFVFLFFFSSTVNAGFKFPVFDRIVQNSSGDIVTTTRSSTGRRIHSYATVTVNQNQYKTLKNLPTKSLFSAPVPVTASAKVYRSAFLNKASVGKLVKGIAKTMTPQGLAFQAVLLGLGYAFQEYTDAEFAADPNLLPGQHKIIGRHEFVQAPPDFNLYAYSSYVETRLYVHPNFSDQIDNCSTSAFNPINVNSIPCYNRPDIMPTYVGFDSPSSLPPVDSFVPLDPVVAETILADPMTDSDFDNMMNNPLNQPAFPVNKPQAVADTELDLDNDFLRSTDTLPDTFPDTTTNPVTKDSFDSNLSGLKVPDYDNTPVTYDTQDTTTPEFITSTYVKVDNVVDGLITTITTTTTTTTADKKTGKVVKTDTSTKVDRITAPDPNNPNSTPAPTSQTITKTTTGTPKPSQVEVTNFPDPVDPVDPCVLHPNSVGCLDAGSNLPAAPPVSNYAVPFSVSQFSLSSNAVCPAPVSFTLKLDGKTYNLKYDPICDFASMINPFIIALGVFSAFLIVSGSVRGGAFS